MSLFRVSAQHSRAQHVSFQWDIPKAKRDAFLICRIYHGIGLVGEGSSRKLREGRMTVKQLSVQS